MLLKLLKGAVIASVFVVGVFGGNVPCLSEKEFLKLFPDRDPRIDPDDPRQRKEMDRRFAEYTGVHWGQNCLGPVEHENNVPLGVADTAIHIGCGYGKKATKYKFKVVVKQTNPCFVVDNHYKAYGVKIRKIDDRTVELIKDRDEWCDVHLFNFGRRGLSYLYKPNEINPNKVHNVLGKNLQCLKQENTETWTLYTKQPDGSYKFFSRETLYYRADHPILKKLGIKP